MKISVDFVKSPRGEVTVTVTLRRGADDPGMVSIDGMARTFNADRVIQATRQFGHGEGNQAKDWSDTVVQDIKHQIDEYRTSIPKDYVVEY